MVMGAWGVSAEMIEKTVGEVLNRMVVDRLRSPSKG
jgi:hypothetical protein